jgi:hypothetical protein
MKICSVFSLWDIHRPSVAINKIFIYCIRPGAYFNGDSDEPLSFIVQYSLNSQVISRISVIDPINCFRSSFVGLTRQISG